MPCPTTAISRSGRAISQSRNALTRAVRIASLSIVIAFGARGIVVPPRIVEMVEIEMREFGLQKCGRSAEIAGMLGALAMQRLDA